jgi:hypothetical protein
MRRRRWRRKHGRYYPIMEDLQIAFELVHRSLIHLW